MVWTIYNSDITEIRNSDISGILYGNSHTTEISSSQLQAQYCLNARPPDLECQKLSAFWSQSYIIIAYIINFQVLSTPGQVQIRFTLYLFEIRLQINWVVELKKVSRMTASLALHKTGPRVQD